MKIVGLGLLLLLIAGAHVAWWPDITIRVQPAFTLAFAVAWGLAFSVRTGFWLAFAGGLLLDFYTQQRFGTFTLASIAAYAVVLAYVGRLGQETGPALSAAVFLGAAAVYEAVVLASLSLFTSNFPFFTQLTRVATLNVLGSAAAFGVAYSIAAAVRKRTTSPHERSLQY